MSGDVGIRWWLLFWCQEQAGAGPARIDRDRAQGGAVQYNPKIVDAEDPPATGGSHHHLNGRPRTQAELNQALCLMSVENRIRGQNGTLADAHVGERASAGIIFHKARIGLPGG